jgi:hypothetical protein
VGNLNLDISKFRHFLLLALHSTVILFANHADKKFEWVLSSFAAHGRPSLHKELSALEPLL